MRDMMGLIMAHVKNTPKKIALVDNSGATRITYEQMDYLSGKVYAYLKSRGIGKEDFVAICLPRSSQPIIAMVGIWKAGAAFVMLEENYAPERTAYIIENCGCKVTINSDLWQEIQEMDSLPGYEMVEPHQAAMAVYTSGSTGNPKGVLHEFGNIDRMDAAANYQGKPYIDLDDVSALMPPLTFVAGCSTAMSCLVNGATLHVLPYAIVKNPAALEVYLEEKRINKIFFSPTLYRALRSISPYLETVILGGEPVSDLYSDQVQLMSAYSMSECGAMIATYKIDKPYPNTPIGKPQCDMKLWILDEEGNEVPDGESGELCVDNPYVRGYIGLPEQNAAAFGEHGVYHTGDIAKKLPDGNYMLLGRCNDMIKISGNRVEPAEVEAAVKKVLGIDWCVAKGFTVGKSTFICAFSSAYGMVSGAFMSVAGIAASLASVKPTLEMAKPIMEAVPEAADDKEIVTDIRGNIELSNVSFRYDEAMPWVLDNLSLKIRAGEYIAIVGSTGCGKSTLLRVLLGFETPQRGYIHYDRKDLTRVDLKSLRRKIGVVMQDGKLFWGDIYSNIVASAPHLTLNDAWEAAEIASVADDIRAMPMGMHTIISEGQGGISGGQRQRLLIARAVASKPKVLMFDEATSALDNITQKKVSDAIDKLKCTRIVIAHRLSTIRHCDRIIVLDKGHIVEEGTYESLIAKNGFFAELVARQRLDTEE